ncbi:MAG: hypothetical protein AAGE92_06780, partial [Cyanobacteria bacterium P01_G01_bin.4]
MWERIQHRLKNYLVAGLLTVIPLATTIWLMVEVATRSIRFLTTIPKQINPIQGIHPILGVRFSQQQPVSSARQWLPWA